MEELWLIWSKDNQGIAHDYFVCFEVLNSKEQSLIYVILWIGDNAALLFLIIEHHFASLD